jgi:hypothetical protein
VRHNGQDLKSAAQRAGVKAKGAFAHKAPSATASCPKPNKKKLAHAARTPGRVSRRIRDIRRILRGSHLGREAIKVFAKYKVKARFAHGGGSYYDQTTNTMVLDTRQGLRNRSLVFVHEMHHAWAWNVGASADRHICRLSRRAYVNGMLHEEAVGTVFSIQARDELARAGINVHDVSFPLQNEYHHAYKQGVARAKHKHPHASKAALDTAGERAGLARVVRGFRNKEVVTSTSGQGYPAFYGHNWDLAHGPGGQC